MILRAECRNANRVYLFGVGRETGRLGLLSFLLRVVFPHLLNGDEVKIWTQADELDIDDDEYGAFV